MREREREREREGERERECVWLIITPGCNSVVIYKDFILHFYRTQPFRILRVKLLIVACNIRLVVLILEGPH